VVGPGARHGRSLVARKAGCMYICSVTDMPPALPRGRTTRPRPADRSATVGWCTEAGGPARARPLSRVDDARPLVRTAAPHRMERAPAGKLPPFPLSDDPASVCSFAPPVWSEGDGAWAPQIQRPCDSPSREGQAQRPLRDPPQRDPGRLKSSCLAAHRSQTTLATEGAIRPLVNRSAGPPRPPGAHACPAPVPAASNRHHNSHSPRLSLRP
jgi:hypothetical protein